MSELYDINDPKLDIYTLSNENQLLHYNEPELGVFIAESANVIIRALDAGYEPVSFLTESGHVEKALEEYMSRYDVPVYEVASEDFRKITKSPMTRGGLCVLKRKALLPVDEVIKNARRIVILEAVMNPTNLGSIFRSAAALNMDAIILTGGCSDPFFRRAARVSMGTAFQIPWTAFDRKMTWPGQGIDWLHENGFKTVAMALKEDSVNIDEPELMAEEKLAIIMGTEAFGLSDETIEKSDYTVMIPMTHGVDSLNVAAASAIAFWQLGK